MQWNNEIQKAIIEEWTEGCQKVKGRRAQLGLRRRIAQKYGLGVYVVQGLIELGATQGMIQGSGDYEKKYEPINYHELVGNLGERVKALERKLEYLLDGVQKVLEDGETMAIHLQHLKQIGRWAKGRDAIDLEDRPRLSISGRR